MKFTFASLMLLLVHAVIGVPLAAQTVRDTGLAEVEPASGASSARPDASGVASATVRTQAFQAMFAMPVLAAPGERHRARTAVPAYPAEQPLHWGMGDRHALDEGKP